MLYESWSHISKKVYGIFPVLGSMAIANKKLFRAIVTKELLVDNNGHQKQISIYNILDVRLSVRVPRLA